MEYKRRAVFHDSIEIYMLAFKPEFRENHACVTWSIVALLLAKSLMYFIICAVDDFCNEMLIRNGC